MPFEIDYKSLIFQQAPAYCFVPCQKIRKDFTSPSTQVARDLEGEYPAMPANPFTLSRRTPILPTPIIDRPNRYHWALLIGPKHESPGPVQGQRYHVKSLPVQPYWKYDEGNVHDVRVTAQLLARVAVAKVEDEQSLIEILRMIAVNPTNWEGRATGREPEWTCRVWVVAALNAIKADGNIVGTNALHNIEEPGGIMESGKAFIVRHQQNARYDSGRDALEPKPLLDMMTGQEAYP